MTTKCQQLTVYHGGTPINTNSFLRSYAAKNSGSIGYYVTTDKEQASAYGPVTEYLFTKDSTQDLATGKLSENILLQLIQETDYWLAFSESIELGTASALKNLSDQSALDALLDVINATGETQIAIAIITQAGFTHYTVEDPRVAVILDANCLSKQQ